MAKSLSSDSARAGSLKQQKKKRRDVQRRIARERIPTIRRQKQNRSIRRGAAADVCFTQHRLIHEPPPP